jgi:hypothetical protein
MSPPKTLRGPATSWPLGFLDSTSSQIRAYHIKEFDKEMDVLLRGWRSNYRLGKLLEKSSSGAFDCT